MRGTASRLFVSPRFRFELTCGTRLLDDAPSLTPCVLRCGMPAVACICNLCTCVHLDRLPFSYRVVAKRADISVPRLKRMKMPDLDSIAKAERLITKGARGRVRARRKRSGGRRGSKRRS